MEEIYQNINNTLVELNLENNNISNKGINSICKYLKNKYSHLSKLVLKIQTLLIYLNS